ncbi:high affinity K+ transporter 5 [Perilla frutescens var. hirtella]|uniref:Potassium transporter n=1 Tax=Perilla frutescens var. hirtella TaxID=608512 RepID=A0AAD4J5N2_PERFH|nr:high affinity K+ transporter 5 [Perilla frutescens var. hirtella]
MSSDAVLIQQDDQPNTNDVVINREEQTTPPLNGRKLSWTKLRRADSLDIESASIGGRHHHSAASMGGAVGWAAVLQLAFQSIGVVYGDIGTSPLYVFASTFTDGIKHNDDIIGVLSLILYTLTLIPLIKYVFIVLRANDNGDGGTFALYSLICRYAKVGLIPSQELEDRDVSTFKMELPNNRLQRASKLQSRLESNNFAKYVLLLATMLGTSMVIGDGILTPCMSVLSAVGGIKEATSNMTEDLIVWTSVAILVLLFMFQRFGTDKVGYTFAPIILIWFSFIAAIGIFNFIKYDPSVIKALNPKYIIDYFKRNKDQAWISLGGVVLAITGTEALFADVGHFSVRSIQISMCSVTYPALVLAYTGQASFLRKNNASVFNTFYDSIPGRMYWPMFVVAVAASIIASQAMISATFSIIQQSLSLGCFPRVKIVHTSTKYPGQVYIPEINYVLMFACVCVTLGFRTTLKIGNAYGIAVVFVMALTSAFLVLVMIMIWKTNIVLVILYVLIIGSIELVYLSSVLYKFDQGGYLPLVFAMFTMMIMFVWNYVYRKKYYFELDHKISPEIVKEIIHETNSQRLPGLAIFYSELVHGIPPIFKHYVANVPALHSVLVFVSFKSLPISRVPEEERFLFRRVQPKELQVFRCVVRYGYKDVRNVEDPFERLLIERLKEFIREDSLIMAQKWQGNENENKNENENEDEILKGDERGMETEIGDLDRAWKSGVVHLVGEHEVMASKGANLGKRVVIDYAYNFMKKNVRQSNTVFDIPHKRMLKVGMTYQL